jgi:hypothetical protein
MTDNRIFRETLQRHLPRRQWITIADIYSLVERHMPLDNEDRLCAGHITTVPRWHTNVRRVLYGMRREGRVMSRVSKEEEIPPYGQGS